MIAGVSAVLWVLVAISVVAMYAWRAHERVDMEYARPLKDTQDAFPAKDQPLTKSELVSALECPGVRADILDILAGIPYDFAHGRTDLPDESLLVEAVLRFAAGAHEAEGPAVDDGVAEAFTTEIRQRLVGTVRAGCQQTPIDCKDSLHQMLPAQVDLNYTSPRARTQSGWLHRAFLTLGEATGLPMLRTRAELFQSRHASVVAKPGPAVAGDCLALRNDSTGENATVSVALQFAGASGTTVDHIVIEQPPRSARTVISADGRHIVIRPRTAPRRFVVFGESVAQSPVEELTRYSMYLGTFEYARAAPAAQAFTLQSTMPAGGIKLRGLRIIFDARGWGDDYICVYRLRVFNGPLPSCSANRVVWHSFPPLMVE